MGLLSVISVYFSGVQVPLVAVVVVVGAGVVVVCAWLSVTLSAHIPRVVRNVFMALSFAP